MLMLQLKCLKWLRVMMGIAGNHFQAKWGHAWIYIYVVIIQWHKRISFHAKKKKKKEKEKKNQNEKTLKHLCGFSTVIIWWLANTQRTGKNELNEGNEKMFTPLDELESARWSQIKREKNIWMYVYKIFPTLLNCLKQQPNLFQQNDWDDENSAHQNEYCCQWQKISDWFAS